MCSVLRLKSKAKLEHTMARKTVGGRLLCCHKILVPQNYNQCCNKLLVAIFPPSLAPLSWGYTNIFFKTCFPIPPICLGQNTLEPPLETQLQKGSENQVDNYHSHSFSCILIPISQSYFYLGSRLYAIPYPSSLTKIPRGLCRFFQHKQISFFMWNLSVALGDPHPFLSAPQK